MRNGLFTFGFFLLSLSACEKLTSSQFRTEDEPLVSYSTPPAITLGDTGSWEGYDSNKKMFYAFH